MTERASEENREIARREVAAFGAKKKDWRVTGYWDDEHVSTVDILHVRDCPAKTVTSYGTIGLSDTPLIMDGEEYPTRVEFVGGCLTNFKTFPEVVAAAAFCVMNSGFFCYPGAVLPDVLGTLGTSKTMRHIYFGNPFIWERKLTPLRLKTKTVSWLLIVPISDRELKLAEKDGPEQLADLLEAKEVDVFDLDRKSAI